MQSERTIPDADIFEVLNAPGSRGFVSTDEHKGPEYHHDRGEFNRPMRAPTQPQSSYVIVSDTLEFSRLSAELSTRRMQMVCMY
jgi:hypothetical protein